jgi:hypothetical protein
VLIPGRLAVKTIERRWVVLDRDGRDLRVDLAPFRTRPGMRRPPPASGLAALTGGAPIPPVAEEHPSALAPEPVGPASETSQAANPKRTP